MSYETITDKKTNNQIAQIIIQARVNGGVYTGDELPANNWTWPTQTWLMRRKQALAMRNYGRQDQLSGGQRV